MLSPLSSVGYSSSLRQRVSNKHGNYSSVLNQVAQASPLGSSLAVAVSERRPRVGMVSLAARGLRTPFTIPYVPSHSMRRDVVVMTTTCDHHKERGLSCPFWDRCPSGFAHASGELYA